MKKFKRTKGSWIIGNGGHFIVSAEKLKCSGYSEHDAKLIAAAPEMLNLLKEMDEYLDPKFEGQINEIKTTSIFHARMKELLETNNK